LTAPTAITTLKIKETDPLHAENAIRPTAARVPRNQRHFINSARDATKTVAAR